VLTFRDTFDQSLITKAIVFMFIMIIPFGFIHESGHALVCLAESIEFDMHISGFGSSIVCNGDVQNKDLFHLMGGLLAFVVAITPYFVAKKHIEKIPFIAIVLLSLAVGHLVNAVVETVIFDSYIVNNVAVTFSINMVSMIAFIYFAWHYSKKIITERQDKVIDTIKEKIDPTLSEDKQTEQIKKIVAEMTPQDKVTEPITSKIVKQMISINKAVNMFKTEPSLQTPPLSNKHQSRKQLKSKQSSYQEDFGFNTKDMFDVNFSEPKTKGRKKKNSFFGEPEW
jgi:hypothetical protein